MNEHIKSLYPWARNYAKGGPKKDKFYNTQLSPQQEQQYQKWVQTLPINLRSDYDYDLRGAWLNGDLPDQNYHMIDKWKKPWHPTFSNESVYSTPQASGGHWDGVTFIPSTINKIANGFKYGTLGANSFARGGRFDGPPINWDYFANAVKENNGRGYNLANLQYIDKRLNDMGYNLPQRQAIIYNIYQESGGDPTAVSDTGMYNGLLQWDKNNRYAKIKDRSLDGQIQYIYDTTYGPMAFNGDNWMGMTREATRAKQAAFRDTDDLHTAMDVFTNGYVRPLPEVRKNRMNDYKNYFPAVEEVKPLFNNDGNPGFRLGAGAGSSFDKGGTIHIKKENRGKFTAAANHAGKSVQAYASQILANKDHYSTTLVKRANFAKNAKKFHH